jgi:2-polyprenyl-6-methoxyphenol hydroxylase-like FAD-dependent oxidoreductase
LGLLDAVGARSGLSRTFSIRDVRGAVMMEIPLGRFDAPAMCIRRADLLSVLLEQLPPERIRLDHRLLHLRQAGEQVQLEFAGGGHAAHDAVIGADGLRSQVRTALFGDLAPIYRGYTIWRGIAPAESARVLPGCNSETWGPGRRFGMLDTGAGRFTWYATCNLTPGQPDGPKGRKAELLGRFQGWHAPICQLIDQTPESAILKNGAYDLTPLPRWGEGRVTLLGDAAHPTTPNLGQGGCMALEDALTLAKCFGAGGEVPAALRRYEALRRPRTRHIQRRSRALGTIGQWEDAVRVRGRQWLTKMIPPRWLKGALAEVYAFQT